MDESMRNRLIQIDNECNEQIDRFGLIFNAAELVGNEDTSLNNLAKINLTEIFKKLAPVWSKQLKRRGISLKIDIPSQLPQILSDSEKLELMFINFGKDISSINDLSLNEQIKIVEK